MIVINVIVGPVRWIREFLFSIIGDISSSVFIYLVVAGRFLRRLSLELCMSAQQSTITVYPLFDMQACPRELPPAP